LNTKPASVSNSLALGEVDPEHLVDLVDVYLALHDGDVVF